MKNRIIILFALFLCVCLAASSCATDVSSLENLCFAVQDFNLAAAAQYVDDSEGYFASASALANGLSREKAEIARKIYSYTSFSDIEEKDGVCTLTVRYVDVEKLKKNVSARVNTGAYATDVLGDIIGGKGLSAYMKTETGVKVTLTKESGTALVPIGRAGVNAEFTSMLGLEAFLGWLTLQI